MASAFDSGGAEREPSPYAALTMDRYITGLVTNRSPLKDADVPYLQAKFYSAGRFDSLWDGINTEISAQSTLIRRPGCSVYNSQIFPPISRFYDFKTVVNGQNNVHVMADTGVAVFDATGPSRKLNIWSKAVAAGKTCFQSVGNTLYFSNLLENKKWMLSTKVWAAGQTFKPGDWIVDTNNNIQLVPPQKIVNVASIAITANVVTVMLQGPDAFVTGTNVVLAGLTQATFLNGVTLQPLAIQVANGFQAAFTNVDYAGMADTGTVTAGSGVGITGGTQPTWTSTYGKTTVDGTVTWLCWGSTVQNWGIAAPLIAPGVVQTNLPLNAYPVWSANTVYSLSPVIIDSNGNIQQLITGGVTGTTQPTWGLYTNTITTDGTARWQCGGSGAWMAGTVYALGALISATFTYYITVNQPNGYGPYGQPTGYTPTQQPVTETDVFVCKAAGTSGTATPQWTTGTGVTTQDGTVVWTNQGSSGRTWTGSIGPGTGVSLAIQIVDANGYFQTLSTSGKSGATAPTWALIQSANTADGTAVWTRGPSYSAAASYPLRWAFAYKSSIDNTTSTASPSSIPVTTGANKIAALQAACSTDPQVDTIVIYRTAQNGSILFQLDQIPQPPGPTWTYNDTSPDTALIVQLQAAIAGVNNPPPVGIQALSFHLGRIFAAVLNYVYWCSGPNAPVGNGLNAWSPVFVAAFPDSIIKLHPVTITNGALFVYSVSDMYAIFGDGTPNNTFQPKDYGPGIGLLNHDALTLIGSTIHLFTTAGKVVTLDPSAGYTEPGFGIGDQFKLTTTGGISQRLYDPATTFVTWHESETADTGLYIADGNVGWFRYSPVSVPETGFLWSPRAAIQGGTSAVQSVMTAPGTKSLLIGPSGTAYFTATAVAPPTLLANLETLATWLQPGSVGNSYGSTATGTFVLTPAATSGTDATFSAAANAPYANGYWYQDLGSGFNSEVLFTCALQVMFATAQDLANCQAFEFELQQSIGGRIYNMAWQANMVAAVPSWRYFTYTNTPTADWHNPPTVIPVNKTQFAPGQYVSIVAVFKRDPIAQTMTHVSLSINGVVNTVNITQPSTAQSQADYVHAAFQLDTTGQATPPSYAVHVRNMNVSMSTGTTITTTSGGGPILKRDLNVNSDNHVPYSNTYADIGSIQLCQPYEECEVAGVVLDSKRIGTAPTIGILYGEIFPTADVPFDLYARTTQDPPNLPPSSTLYNDRFSTMQDGNATVCRHMQLRIQWSVEDAASELLAHTIYGAKHAERKVQ